LSFSDEVATEILILSFFVFSKPYKLSNQIDSVIRWLQGFNKFSWDC